VLAVTAKSFSVVTVTAVMSIVGRAVLIWPVLTHCIEQPNVTDQHAVVDTTMRIANVDFGHVDEKK